MPAIIDCLVAPDFWNGISEMMKLAGIEWIPDRISWGEVEPQKDKFDWANKKKL